MPLKLSEMPQQVQSNAVPSPKSKVPRKLWLKRSLWILIPLALVVVAYLILARFYPFWSAVSKEPSDSTDAAPPAPRSSDCVCGYTDAIQRILWTDKIEVDWTSLSSFQDQRHFKVTQRRSTNDRGSSYQKCMYPSPGEVSDVGYLLTPLVYLPDQVALTSQGLDLKISPFFQDNGIPSAEICSIRKDILYGTFRVRLSLPLIPGTCTGFFYYFDDRNEIDFEFLTSFVGNGNRSTAFTGIQGPFPDNIRDQSRWRVFNYTQGMGHGFETYRFDWMPSTVSFFVGNELLSTLTQVSPTVAGSLLINHWANGAPGWSQGPPPFESILRMASVTAYFNSSDADRLESFERSCQASRQSTGLLTCSL